MKLDLDRIVHMLEGAGVPALLQQTGGGVATIYAGEPRPGRYYGGEETDLYPAVAGPGWFEGPNDTQARADTAEFSVSPDGDDDPSKVWTADGRSTERSVTAEIIRLVRSGPERSAATSDRRGRISEKLPK